MAQNDSSLKEREKILIIEPASYNVIFHNDDFTPMDFVVFLLENIFNHNKADAVKLMLKVHNEGKAIVGSYSYDIAMSKAERAIQWSRNENFPLRITVEKS